MTWRRGGIAVRLTRLQIWCEESPSFPFRGHSRRTRAAEHMSQPQPPPSVSLALRYTQILGAIVMTTQSSPVFIRDISPDLVEEGRFLLVVDAGGEGGVIHDSTTSTPHYHRIQRPPCTTAHPEQTHRKFYPSPNLSWCVRPTN